MDEVQQSSLAYLCIMACLNKSPPACRYAPSCGEAIVFAVFLQLLVVTRGQGTVYLKGENEELSGAVAQDAI